MRNFDIFVNVAGGIKVVEPAVDLGVTVAITSSLKESPVQIEDVPIGEVGLGGEVRGVAQVRKRVTEAAKLGFRRAIIPKSNLKEFGTKEAVELIGVSTVQEAVEVML